MYKGTVIPALITPYRKDGSLHLKALEQLCDALLAQGVRAFYVSGSTGEAFLQTPEERMAVIETVCGHCKGRAHLIFQTGAISTDQAVSMAQFAARCGVDEISSLPPFYYKFTPKEIERYYLDLMDATDRPMIIYNIPLLTGVSMPEACPALFSDPRVSAVKQTTSNFFELRQLHERFPNLTLYSGFDEMALAGLSMGADGMIGSTYNYQAERFLNLHRLYRQGKPDEALALQDQANQSIQLLLKFGLYNSVRYLVTRKHGIDVGPSRKPFAPLSDEAKNALDQLPL